MKPIASAPSRAEQAYAAIRDSICDGTLGPGTHLVQEELAAKLGVSRQPVQQAMVLLRNDGLVLELGSRGLYVAPLEAEAIAHRYQIRVVLDQLAARLVAEQAASSPEFRDRLLTEGGKLVDRGDAAVRSHSVREAVGVDVEFHSFIYEMSGNPLIGTTAEPHWHYLRRVMIDVLRYADRGKVVWDQHREILRTLASGDASASVEIVTAHVLGAERALVEVIEVGKEDAVPGGITSGEAA